MASNHVFDATKAKRATRTIIDADGNPVVERRPVQASVLALNPAGHVVWFPLYTGPAQTAQDDPYRTRVTFEKARWGTGKSKKPGFLFLDRCPLSHSESYRNLPEHLRGRPVCHQGAKGGPITQHNPCSCIFEAQKSRRARNDAEMAESNRALKTVAEKTAEAHAEAISAAKEVTQAAEKVVRASEDRSVKK